MKIVDFEFNYIIISLQSIYSYLSQVTMKILLWKLI